MTTIVVLSGGQDSTTCLAWAIYEYGVSNVKALTFDYEQRHSKEINAAEKIARTCGVSHYIWAIPKLHGTSPLISNTKLGQYETPADLPGGVEPTFVPCRNILFLTLAANYGLLFEQSGLKQVNIVIGVSQADFGGYFDCREDFIVAMENTINLGVFGEIPVADDWSFITIETPLINRTKKQTVLLAEQLGALHLMAETWTCYDGGDFPCRKCHACVIRERGFLETGIPDPLIQKYGLPWPPEWSLEKEV